MSAVLVALLLTESEYEVLLHTNQLTPASITGNWSSFLSDLAATSRRFDMTLATGASLIVVEHLAPPLIPIVALMSDVRRVRSSTKLMLLLL